MQRELLPSEGQNAGKPSLRCLQPLPGLASGEPGSAGRSVQGVSRGGSLSWQGGAAVRLIDLVAVTGLHRLDRSIMPKCYAESREKGSGVRMGAARFDNVSRTAPKVGVRDAWAVPNAARHVVRAGLVSRRHWSDFASIAAGSTNRLFGCAAIHWPRLRPLQRRVLSLVRKLREVPRPVRLDGQECADRRLPVRHHLAAVADHQPSSVSRLRSTIARAGQLLPQPRIGSHSS